MPMNTQPIQPVQIPRLRKTPWTNHTKRLWHRLHTITNSPQTIQRIRLKIPCEHQWNQQESDFSLQFKTGIKIVYARNGKNWRKRNLPDLWCGVASSLNMTGNHRCRYWFMTDAEGCALMTNKDLGIAVELRRDSPWKGCGEERAKGNLELNLMFVSSSTFRCGIQVTNSSYFRLPQSSSSVVFLSFSCVNRFCFFSNSAVGSLLVVARCCAFSVVFRFPLAALRCRWRGGLRSTNWRFNMKLQWCFTIRALVREVKKTIEKVKQKVEEWSKKIVEMKKKTFPEWGFEGLYKALSLTDSGKWLIKVSSGSLSVNNSWEIGLISLLTGLFNFSPMVFLQITLGENCYVDRNFGLKLVGEISSKPHPIKMPFEHIWVWVKNWKPVISDFSKLMWTS